MLYCITGGINTGKTSKLLDIFANHQQGCGFASEKVFQSSQFSGYRLKLLPNKETIELAYLKHNIPDDWDEIYQIGRFSFSAKAFHMAASHVHTGIRLGMHPIFLDEMGPLELQNKGFASLFTSVLASHLDTYVCIRDSCLQDVLRKFQVEQYKIV